MSTREATEDDLVLNFMPPLITLLSAQERDKGEPLTEDEVLAVRDGAVCLRVPSAVRDALALERGYADLDPDLVWPQWQQFRTWNG